MTVPSDTAHVDPSTVDLNALGAWMDQQALPAAKIEDVTPLGGGTQNIMLRFARGPRTYVLRRGPKHLRAKSNDAIRREAVVLTALADTDVPAPRVVASCPDEDVLGAAFYLMEPVDGYNAATTLPEPFVSDAALRHEMGLQAVTALATVGAVDHVAVGLSDIGHPAGFLERQVPRWLSELESYDAHDGYPGAQLPHLDEVASWLEAHRPTTFEPGIMHGDFHLANLMYAFDGPYVAAIVDWEMCTIGDPLLDLGWLVATWPVDDTGMGAQSVLGHAGGLPATAELIEHYAQRSSRDLSSMPWYAALACFKLAIILEGTYARSFAGKAPVSIGEYLHRVTIDLFERAHRIITEGLS